MIVEGHYKSNVGYIVSDYWDEPSREWIRQPIGTVFFVEVKLKQTGTVLYAITCRHVILPEADSPARPLLIRINRTDGTSEDLPAPFDSWISSEETDLAACRMSVGPGYKFWAYPISGFGSEIIDEAAIGHDVFLVGLFYMLPGQNSVEALVRSGTVAKELSKVPIKLNPKTDEITWVDGYLVEALAWGGESGSPVFGYRQEYAVSGQSLEDVLDPDRIDFMWARNMPVEAQVNPRLLGVLQGHFPLDQDVHSDSARSLSRIGGVSVNSGIAIVLPAKQILELLRDPRILEEEERIMQERLRKTTHAAKPLGQ